MRAVLAAPDPIALFWMTSLNQRNGGQVAAREHGALFAFPLVVKVA